MTRVAVVGAGVGGLACGARLAARGHDVQVFEQADVVGGKLGIHEQDGFRFDTGPSLLTWPQLVHDVLDHTATDGDDASLELQQVDPIAHYRYPDGTTLTAHANRERMRRAFDTSLGLGTGAAWARLMERAERMWDAIEQPILSQPQPGVAGLANQARRLTDLGKIAPHRTLRSIGQQYLHHPHQQQFLERYATYTGSDPRRAPAVLATIPWLEQTTGAWYVAGGLHRIAEVLADRITAHGGQVHTSARVDTIATTGDAVTGVTLADGTRIAADVVIANNEARSLYGRVLEHPNAPRWRKEVERAEPSLSGFVVLLGLDGRTPDLSHHTVLFNADFDAEFDAIFGREPQPVPDPTIYVSVPDDPTTAPDGSEAWFVLVNAARQGPVDWDADDTAARYAEHVIDLMAKRGLDVRHRIRTSTWISPADLARRTGALGGAIYGTSSNGWRAAAMRPANRGPIDGLYLVGGSAHPGGGLPLVLKSAEITTGLIDA
ncbi:MAG: phytoene desaturase [Actinobacteria bacterium]|nr:phytoene desaturase [Actinomycetota bacterium]